MDSYLAVHPGEAETQAEGGNTGLIVGIVVVVILVVVIIVLLMRRGRGQTEVEG